MNTKISVFIITYNEEKIIAKCLEKLSWADEIVVIDSGSTDNTIAICKEFNAKIFYNKFENFGLQKQFALQKTENNWVFSLDSDEVLSDKLIEEIKKNIFSDKVSGYKIPRTHVFLNKIFNYGSENKKPILRLFNKNKGNFNSNKVHETIEIDGTIENLENEMLHYTVSDLSTAVRKQINYAFLSGEFLFEKGKKTSKLKPILKFPYDFIRVYIFQLNFMNGYQGFIWSILSAFASFLKYAKLLELNKK